MKKLEDKIKEKEEKSNKKTKKTKSQTKRTRRQKEKLNNQPIYKKKTKNKLTIDVTYKNKMNTYCVK